MQKETLTQRVLWDICW